MVLLRLYVDKNTDLSREYAQMQIQKYHIASQPFYVIMNPNDESSLGEKGGYIPNEFVEFLDSGLENWNIVK